jgi:copper resistance protein C
VTVIRPTRVLRALLPGLVLLAVVASPALAHAELVSSDPTDKAQVESAFNGPITLTYDEALYPGSRADLRGPDGSVVASAEVDGATLVFTLDGPLDAGAYTIQWTSIAVDRDIERGTLTFTVVPAPPTATPGATANPAPSATATASPAPTGGGGAPAGSTGDIIVPLLAAVIAVGAIGAFLLRNRRTAGR